MKLHTPGPWIVANGLQVWQDGKSAIHSPRICTLLNAAHPVDQIDQSEMAANARLIAAAPDLMAAGKHLAVKLAEVYRAAGLRPAACQAIDDWLRLVRHVEGGVYGSDRSAS